MIEILIGVFIGLYAYVVLIEPIIIEHFKNKEDGNNK